MGGIRSARARHWFSPGKSLERSTFTCIDTHRKREREREKERGTSSLVRSLAKHTIHWTPHHTIIILSGDNEGAGPKTGPPCSSHHLDLSTCTHTHTHIHKRYAYTYAEEMVRPVIRPLGRVQSDFDSRAVGAKDAADTCPAIYI